MARERIIGLAMLLATLVGAIAIYAFSPHTATVTAQEIITVDTSNLSSSVNVWTYGMGTADMGYITVSGGSDLSGTATYRLYIELVGYSGDGRLRAAAIRIVDESNNLVGAITLASPIAVIEDTVTASGGADPSDTFTLKLWYVAVQTGPVTIDLKISVEVVSVSS